MSGLRRQRKGANRGSGRARRRSARTRVVGGLVVFFACVWLLWNTPVVAPLKIFVVLLHEVSHALAAVATGGSVDRIVVTADQGGACYCGGGNAFLTLSAGYLGSLLWGAGLLLAARGLGRWSRWIVAVIGSGIAVLSVVFIHNPFGLLFGLGFGALLVLAARHLSAVANARILLALGLTSCLYAILDIKSDILDRPELRSDARMLAELTGVPTLVWGVAWIAVGLAVTWALFRRMLREA